MARKVVRPIARPQDIPAKVRQSLGKWYFFPDMLPTRRFGGLNARENETQQQGDFVLGENVTFANSRIPTVRAGYQTIGTEAENATPVNRAWIFETRNGDQFELKAYDTYVDFWLVGQSTEYAHLLTGLTPGLEFGYGNIGRTSDVTNYTNFCNGEDEWYRFNGAWATYASDNGSDQITVEGSTTLANLGFSAQTSAGGATTQFDITNPVGTTFRYTFDGTGTNPGDFTTLLVVGSKVWIGAQNFNAANNGIFTVTAVASTYFEVTNASGVVESNKTIGTGFLYVNLESFVVNGTVVYYKTLSNQTFVGVNTIPVMAVGDLIVQSPNIVPKLTSFKGSVVMAHDGRLHARLDSKKSVWNYSKLDDPWDWTAGAIDGAGGAKEVEFGGPITSFGKLNKTALCLKNGIIKSLSFKQVGTRIDTPVYDTLVTADDKGTTLGANNQKSTFSTPLGMVFITPDKRMVLLTGVTANNEPQYLFLDDQIQPIFTAGVHDEASGICVNNTVWYSFKQDINSTYNDVVIKGDLTRQTTTTEGKVIPISWDTPYIGWNVSDWTVVFDAELGKNVVHWHSSINSNSYELIDNKTDNTQPYTAIIRSWAEQFGIPHLQKKVDYIYLEVNMTENTELLVTPLYDEDGVTGAPEYVLLGTSTNQKFDSSFYNPFGSSKYGSQKIGSNELAPDLKKYRFYIETPNNLYFFILSLQIACNKAGNDFQLIRFGYRITEVLNKLDRNYKVGIS